MADYAKLEDLIASVLEEMRRLGYSENTMMGFRRSFNAFARHAESRSEGVFTEKMAIEYLNGRFGCNLEHLYQTNPGNNYLKHFLRAMRLLLEYQECGCICKRMSGSLVQTKLPSGLQGLLDSYNEVSRSNGLSESTVYSRSGRIKHFLLYLAEGGGIDASCIKKASAHDYILTKASIHAKSVNSILAAIRCFYRHLFLERLIETDLVPTVPRPKIYYAPELPVVWKKEDVEALLESIDRGNPAGRRDYAMILMVARLGLRASDIKSIRITDFDWDERRISIRQHKTGVALELPLLDDIGWAVIDYLRCGRPEGASCPELFVRQVAPFEPFPDTSNLTYILSKRARGAGVRVTGDRKTLHSLRHALATRLLEQRVPLEDISRILGHVNKRTTGIYLRMDIDSLMPCALDPEAVGR